MRSDADTDVPRQGTTYDETRDDHTPDSPEDPSLDSVHDRTDTSVEDRPDEAVDRTDTMDTDTMDTDKMDTDTMDPDPADTDRDDADTVGEDRSDTSLADRSDTSFGDDTAGTSPDDRTADTDLDDRTADTDLDNRFREDRQPGFPDADEDRQPGFPDADEDRIAEEDRITTEDRAAEAEVAAAVGAAAVGTAAVPDQASEPVPGTVGQHDDSARGLKPGEATQDAATAAATWQAGQADEYRERWRQVQVRFLDEPQAAAEEAERLVGEVLDSLTRALAGQKSTLDGWRSTDRRDTEELRVTVRGYRDLLDRVLAL